MLGISIVNTRVYQGLVNQQYELRETNRILFSIAQKNTEAAGLLVKEHEQRMTQDKKVHRLQMICWYLMITVALLLIIKSMKGLRS